jgi:hypothetical protein
LCRNRMVDKIVITISRSTPVSYLAWRRRWPTSAPDAVEGLGRCALRCAEIGRETSSPVHAKLCGDIPYLNGRPSTPTSSFSAWHSTCPALHVECASFVRGTLVLSHASRLSVRALQLNATPQHESDVSLPQLCCPPFAAKLKSSCARLLRAIFALVQCGDGITSSSGPAFSVESAFQH